MSTKLRVLPLLLLVLLAFSLPALAQDMPANETMSADGMITYAADSCDYGGEIQSITAVDAQTVQFQLCHPDPAFPSKVAFSAFSITRCPTRIDGRRRRLADQSDRHRSVEVRSLGSGQRNRAVTRNDDYWGDPAKEDDADLPLELGSRRASGRASGGHGRWYRQPGPDRLRRHRRRPEPVAGSASKV